MSAAFFAPGKTRVAVVTGQHAYDVPAFQTLFRRMTEIDAFVQTLDDWVMDVGGLRKAYDVAVFYNMHRATPGGEQSRYPKGTREVIEQLGASTQGIVVLHHALLAFPEWVLWSDIVGIHDRRFGYHMAQNVRVDVASRSHPITRGVDSWQMLDETYTMDDAGAGSEVLLTTAHPLSMKTIAWTRMYGQARVFCFESGHDNAAYANSSFANVLARGIQWAAGKL